MLTGTPLDLTPFGSVLKGIGVLYWLFVVLMIGLGVFKIKRVILKIIVAIIILVAMVSPVAIRVANLQEKQRLHQAKLDEANKLFESRCKNAGEHISKIIDGVDSVVWMKWRNLGVNPSDQYMLYDPYGHDCSGEYCIQDLLRATLGLENDPQKKQPYHSGFEYVETIDPRDNQLYRYRLRLPEPHPALSSYPSPVLEREAIREGSASYGITWDDISTKEDRDKWIAGGSLKIIDLKTNEVVAERIGYLMDRGQGSLAGFRSPWVLAACNACPAFAGGMGHPYLWTSSYVKRILIPTK